MGKSLAAQYLDCEITVEEYTAAVIAETNDLSMVDLARREHRIVIEIGDSASDGAVVIKQIEGQSREYLTC